MFAVRMETWSTRAVWKLDYLLLLSLVFPSGRLVPEQECVPLGNFLIGRTSPAEHSMCATLPSSPTSPAWMHADRYGCLT